MDRIALQILDDGFVQVSRFCSRCSGLVPDSRVCRLNTLAPLPPRWLLLLPLPRLFVEIQQ